jgi:RND family efflux transporter MFP subunit
MAVHYAPAAAAQVFSGSVLPRTSAALAFRVGGKVVTRPVEVGDHVKAGQVLATLDLSDLTFAQEAAEAAMRAAQADAVNARGDLARYERLGQHSSAYLPSEYDRRVAASSMADARLAQAARQVALASNQHGYGTLTADADGIVTALPAEVGQVLSAGQTVVTIAHTAETEIAVDVPENRLGQVRAAGEVTLSLWADPGKQLHGRVREIGALADAASRTFAVRVTVLDAPPGLLALGMTATVSFVSSGAPVAPLPATALSDHDGQPAVWVLNGERRRVTLRQVEIAGYRADGNVLVRKGLAEGEEVVTAGTSQITPDMALTAWAGATR